jgi:outer membrane protein assembly factor BamB
MIRRVMWTMILVCGSLMGCVDPAGPEGASLKPTVKRMASKAQLNALGLQAYWTGQVPLKQGERITKMWAVGDALYFLTTMRNLYAFDARVGVPTWAINVTTKNEPIFAPSIYRGMRLSKIVGGVREVKNPPAAGSLPKFDATVINTATRVLVIDQTGRAWRDFAYRNFSSSAQAATDGWNIFVPTPTKLYCGVRLNEAVTCWRNEINAEMIKAPLVVYEKNLFVGTMGGSLVVRNTEDGSRVWLKPLPGTIAHPFLVDDRGIFLACGDKNIYGINRASGKRIWYPCTVKGEFVGPLRATTRSLLQGVQGEGLYCVNITTGKARWINASLRKPLALIKGNLFCLDADGNIQIVNEITGKVSGKLPATAYDFVGTNLTAVGVFGATESGKVYCLRPADAGMLTVSDLNER